MISGLEFDEARHRYTLDGRELPSVTTILKDAGLVDYSYGNDYARERGSVVHKAIHLELTTGLDWSTLDEPLHPYVSAALLAIEELGAKVRYTERRVASRIFGYAGTLDLGLDLRRDFEIWDLKSGEPPEATGIQLSGYAEALFEETGERARALRALRLYPDGTYKLTTYNDRQNRDRFRAAITVAAWRRERGLAA
jgi:hypothetical protein